MIREAIDRIVTMVENKTYNIGDKTYSDRNLVLIEDPRYSPSAVGVSGIESLVGLIKTEIDRLNAPLFVEVDDYKTVSVYSTYDERFERQDVYLAKSDMPEFRFGWKPYNEAMIVFRSQFKQNGDVPYILDLLSKITDENSVSSEDNGLSQTVQVKKGVALKGTEMVRPIVKLTPYRTFMEIEQPESEFLLRLDEGGQIGLFEADGGMWKLEAKRRIAEQLKILLEDLVIQGKVVVMF